MKSKDIQDKVKALYANVEPGHFEVKDTTLINNALTSDRFKELHNDPEWKEEWHKRNSKRLEDPEYREKMSAAGKQWHIDNPGALKERISTPEAKAKHKKSMQEYVNSPDYVHPRGMLGKKRTEEAKLKSSIALSGKAKPLEGNKKLSDYHMGKKKDPKIVAKVSKARSGTTHNRSRAVNTSVKNFNKVVDAARYFDVSEMSIKNWCNKKGTTIRYSSVIKKLKDKGIKLNENNYPIGFEWAEGRENLGAKKVHTDKGVYDNTQLAAEAYNISANAMRTRCLNDKWPDFYYLEERSEFKSQQIKDT